MIIDKFDRITATVGGCFIAYGYLIYLGIYWFFRLLGKIVCSIFFSFFICGIFTKPNLFFEKLDEAKFKFYSF